MNTKSVSSINTRIAEQLTGCGEKVTVLVVDLLVKKELDRRADALVAAVAKSEQLTREFHKMKADVISYDQAGVQSGEALFSKQRIEERKKVAEKIERIDRAVAKATEKDDWSDLFNLSQQATNDAKPIAPGSAE